MTIASGGTLTPGAAGVPGTSMTITGNLAFQSGALYVVYLNRTTSTFANVTGTASLTGTVNANFASGSSLASNTSSCSRPAPAARSDALVHEPTGRLYRQSRLHG